MSKQDEVGLQLVVIIEIKEILPLKKNMYRQSVFARMANLKSGISFAVIYRHWLLEIGKSFKINK